MKHEYDIEIETIPIPQGLKYIPGAPSILGYRAIIYRDVNVVVAKKETSTMAGAKLWAVRRIWWDRLKLRLQGK